MHRLASILSKNNYSNSTSRSNTSWTAYRAQGSLRRSPDEATHCCCCSAGSHTPGPSPPLLAARTPRHQHDLVPPTMGWCLERRRLRLPPRRRRAPATPSSRRRQPAQARRPTPRKRSAGAVASPTRRAASARLRWSSAPPPSSLPLPVLPAPVGAWSAAAVGGRRRRAALPLATRLLPEAVKSALLRSARRGLGIRAPAAAAASVVAAAAAPALAVAAGWLRLLRPTACCWTSLAPAARESRSGRSWLGAQAVGRHRWHGFPPLLTLTARSPWQRPRESTKTATTAAAAPCFLAGSRENSCRC